MTGKKEPGAKQEIDAISKEIIAREKKSFALLKKEIQLENTLSNLLSKMLAVDKGKTSQAKKITGEKKKALYGKIANLKKRQAEYEKRKIVVAHIKEKQELLKRQLQTVEQRIRQGIVELYNIDRVKKAHKKGKTSKKTILQKVEKKLKIKMPKQKLVEEKKPVKLKPAQKKDTEKILSTITEEIKEVEPEEAVPETREEEMEGPEEKEEISEEEAEPEKEEKAEEEMLEFKGHSFSFVYPDWKQSEERDPDTTISLAKDSAFFEFMEIPADDATLDEFMDEYAKNFGSESGFEVLSKKEEEDKAFFEYTISKNDSLFLFKEIFVLKNRVIYKIAYSAPQTDFYKIDSLYYKTMESLKTKEE